MAGRITQVFYKGKRIYIHDFKGLSVEEALVIIPVLAKETAGKNDKEQLIILDITGGKATTEIVSAMKKAAIQIKPVTKKMAIVGITPLQKVILNAVNMVMELKVTPFDTLEQAKEWLIKE